MIPFYEKKTANLYGSLNRCSPFPPHLHMDLELIYVISGHANLQIGTETITLHTNDLAIVFPNTIHSYLGSDEENKVIMLICSSDLLGEYLNRLIKYSPSFPVIYSENIHKDVVYALYSLLNELDHIASPISLGSQCALTQLILARTLPYLTLIKNTTILESDMTSKVITYICDNFTKPLSLDLLSTELGINKYYISRIFTKKIGISFNDYVNSLRIDYSKKLLTTTDLSILEIANNCGFETQRTYNRIFKGYTQIPPLKYRNKN